MKAATKKTFNVPVVVERDDDGYFAFVPQIQGCYSQGTTYEAVIHNIREAIDACILDMFKGSEKISFKETTVSLANLEVAV